MGVFTPFYISSADKNVLFSFRFDKYIYTYILLHRPENDSK
jgi:hypothetical protein